jgi:biotin-(acetyl-CoA carboxylase) ligase
MSVGFAATVGRYAARLSMMGKRIGFRRGGRDLIGEVAGVGEDGGLRVHASGQGTLTLYDEEITIT